MILGVVALGYRRQATSWLGHWTGAPRASFPMAEFVETPLLRMAVVGDVGDSGGHQGEVALAMAEAAGRDPYEVLLLLGDNVYPAGDPERLDEVVLEPFAPVLESGARLYAILGNHDALHPDGGLEQIRRLGMPGPWWSADLGDVLLIGLDSNRLDDPDQLSWLEETLAAAEQTWKIVAVHHPPYSAGYQGSEIDAREKLVPIFERYGVQLVLSGHDHDYQRSVCVEGVTYVVSGAGAGVRRTAYAGFTAYAAATLSFAEVSVFPDCIVVRAINEEVRLFDQVELES